MGAGRGVRVWPGGGRFSRLFLVLVWFSRLLGDEDCFCGCRWFFLCTQLE